MGDYDRMTTAELTAAAEEKGLDLDAFAALPNNDARRQALTDYDQAQPGETGGQPPPPPADTPDVGSESAEVLQPQPPPPPDPDPPTTDTVQTGSAIPEGVQVPDPVPHPTEESAANAAAAGQAPPENRDQLEVEPVGGAPGYVDDEGGTERREGGQDPRRS